MKTVYKFARTARITIATAKGIVTPKQEAEIYTKRIASFIRLLEKALADCDAVCRADKTPLAVAKMAERVGLLAHEMSEDCSEFCGYLESCHDNLDDANLAKQRWADSYLDQIEAADTAFGYVAEEMTDAAVEIHEGRWGFRDLRDSIKIQCEDIERLGRKMHAFGKTRSSK